jgi:hypothetical protein
MGSLLVILQRFYFHSLGWIFWVVDAEYLRGFVIRPTPGQT